MSAMDDVTRVHLETLEQWRSWLAEHHASEKSVWLVSWRRPTGKTAIGYEESVVEALAYGWIDSVQRKIDDDRNMLYFARRKPGSVWARPNKKRVAALERDGRMMPAGRAVIDAAKADGSWTILDDVEDLVVPDDLAAALDRVPGGRAHWDAFPPSAKKACLTWVVLAKRPETRQQRIDEIATRAAKGERAR